MSDSLCSSDKNLRFETVPSHRALRRGLGDGYNLLLPFYGQRPEGYRAEVHFVNVSLLQGNLQFGMAIGFVATLAFASVLNRFGDFMFRKGVARPFFVGRYRLHHRRFLFVFLPTGYAILSLMVLAGYVEIVWSDFWTGIVSTLVIAASCLLLDLGIDYAEEGRGWGFIHHELIYLAVPAFAFSDFLRLVV